MTIEQKLKELKEKNEGALAMFATAGDPDLGTSTGIFRVMGQSGADLIEIGIPYSDPLMDGPVLQKSYQRALKNGFKLKKFPSFIESVCVSSGVPVLIMTCYNPVYKYGLMRFFRDISSAGADTILLTDLPPEEWGDSMELARQFNLGTVLLLTPTTPENRMALIDELSHPFVYCVSMTGITGSAIVPDSLKDYIGLVKKIVTRPVLVGFGISSPREAALVGGMADGVVVGSALVRLVEKYGDDKEKMYAEIADFVSGLKKALKRKK